MKLPKPMIAGLGVLLVGLTPLTQAAPGPQNGNGPGEGAGQQQGHQQGQQQRPQGGQQQQQQQQQQGHSGTNPGQGNAHGNNGQQASKPGNNQGGGRPPQDFSNIRQTISSHKSDFGRGNALPADVHVYKGKPLPRGYGARLSPGALAHLPHYQGYEWRRLGADVVLVAVTTGIVYEILSGVLY